MQRPTLCGPKEVIEQLQRKVEELEKKVEVHEQSQKLNVRMVAPFTPSIMGMTLPRDFRLPSIKAYIKMSNTRVHMTRYKVAMVMIGADNIVMCRAFLSTLDRTTQE